MSLFVLDTNVISDIVNPKPKPEVIANIKAHRQYTICLCEAVDYEVRRGYLRTSATSKLAYYEEMIKPQFQWLAITDLDWKFASQLWADTVNQGKQLSDIDLLIAALIIRINAVLVSADADFDALPVTRINWRFLKT